jgi:hypothetical protein
MNERESCYYVSNGAFKTVLTPKITSVRPKPLMVRVVRKALRANFFLTTLTQRPIFYGNCFGYGFGRTEVRSSRSWMDYVKRIELDEEFLEMDFRMCDLKVDSLMGGCLCQF